MREEYYKKLQNEINGEKKKKQPTVLQKKNQIQRKCWPKKNYLQQEQPYDNINADICA